jgi:hypothetical protein
MTGSGEMTGDEALERAYAELLNFADEEERRGDPEKAAALRFAAAVTLHHHGDPEAGAERVERERRRVIEEQKEWLEDILAGLLSNGVRHNEIHIHRHPRRTVVTVRGVAKYELERTPRDAASPGAGILR